MKLLYFSNSTPHKFLYNGPEGGNAEITQQTEGNEGTAEKDKACMDFHQELAGLSEFVDHQGVCDSPLVDPDGGPSSITWEELQRQKEKQYGAYGGDDPSRSGL